MKIKAHKGGRTERIYLRVTPQEKTELLALAKVAGLSFSDWLVKTHLTQRAADFACTCEKFEDFTALTDPACPVHGRASQSR